VRRWPTFAARRGSAEQPSNARPWQEGSHSGLAWSIANIYPASPDDGAPKWGIRSHPPRQLVGLEGHYKSQGLGVPVRPVSPFFRSFPQPRSSLHAAARYWSPLRSTAQITRAFLLATATVARLCPRRCRSSFTQLLRASDLRVAVLTTARAP
jgi:hypothetical protein